MPLRGLLHVKAARITPARTACTDSMPVSGVDSCSERSGELCSRRKQASLGRATKTAQTFVCAVFVVCRQAARIGRRAAASYSCTQCFAALPQASLGRATKTAQTFVCAVFVVCRQAARIGRRAAAGYSCTQCFAAQPQASLGRANKSLNRIFDLGSYFHMLPNLFM